MAHEVGMAALDKDTGRVMLIQARAHLLLIRGSLHVRISSRTALRMLRLYTRCMCIRHT
jgi:hypothetical protein